MRTSFRLRPLPMRLAVLGLLLGAAALPRPAMAQDDGEPTLEQGEDFNKGGRTAFQFLKIGVGARQAALGEASVALVRDVSAAFWNPGGIAGIERYEASLTYTRWLADMNYGAAAIGARVEGIGTFAVSVAALDYGDIPEAVVGTGATDPRTGNTFSGSDFMAGLSYAREFTDRLAIGLGVKYLHENLWEERASTVAFDVGTNYEVGYRGLRLAMSAQNLGGSVSWRADSLTDRQDGYDLPLVFRVGVSASLAGPDAFVQMDGPHRVVAAVEAINTNDFSERLHLGLEYTFSDLFALRGGYRLNYAEGNWSVGAGLTPTVGDLRLRVDYAYVGYEFLTAPHRLSVGFAF
jgi:hypothetical protein